MIKAAEKMHKNLLGKTSGALEDTMSQQSEDPERLIPQQPEDLHPGHDLAPRHQARDLALPQRLRE